jgi:glycosyltransferase involved in cell wall biosynthesis
MESLNMPKRLAIVSSGGATCGVASYSRILSANLAACGIAADHLTFDEGLMRSGSAADARLADCDIDALAKELGAYDLVNIQFEAGIFGARIDHAAARLRRLMAHARSLIFTPHTIEKPAVHHHPWLRSASLLLRGRLEKRREFRHAQRHARGWAAVYSALRDYQRDRRLYCVVHSREDRQYYERTLGVQRVFDHPLSYVLETEYDATRQHRVAARAALCARLGLDAEADVLVGVFGFISPYKGIGTAIRAVARLPQRFKLIIFGELHPAGLPVGTTDRYLDQLLKEIGANDLGERVHFMTGLTDQEFRTALAACDAPVFPYLEVGQRSSGPIKIATELGCPVLCSRTKCFMGLAEYYPARFNFFDVGNYHHLSTLLLALQEGRIPRSYPYPKGAPNPHTLSAAYARCIDELSEAQVRLPAATSRLSATGPAA